ncbi:MAG: polyisoprenoid-binding protein YceI [Saprospiraceae bacterium]|jgi:polyisoprenoid-binding protein YceI
MINHLLTATALAAAISTPLYAAQYTLDPTHSFVTFKIQHLGTSWMHGGFNTISGSMEYDADDVGTAAINVDIDAASIDTNHAERDKHLRGSDFLEVESHPTATFNSTSFAVSDNGGTLTGDLTIKGMTNSVSFDVTKVGEGADPWGGYRVGFTGTLELTRADYGIDYNLGPASASMELTLSVEGIRK